MNFCFTKHQCPFSFLDFHDNKTVVNNFPLKFCFTKHKCACRSTMLRHARFHCHTASLTNPVVSIHESLHVSHCIWQRCCLGTFSHTGRGQCTSTEFITHKMPGHLWCLQSSSSDFTIEYSLSQNIEHSGSTSMFCSYQKLTYSFIQFSCFFPPFFL